MRVVTERVPSVRSVALGFWIATGSAAERDGEAGISHLLEHMLFRGTERYGSEEIDQIFDAMGAEINAGTDKEATSLYTRVLDRHLERAFDVMSDMVWHPRFGELEAEREVVLEEIAMYEDDPQDRVFDLLGRAVFGAHPLGRPVIGTAEVVAAVDARAAGRLPRGALPAAEHRDRGRRLGRARRARASWRAAWRRRARARSTAPRRRLRRRMRQAIPTSSAARALPGERHRAVPRVRRRRAGWPATTSAASRCACSKACSAGPPPRGCSRRCASAAGSPTRCSASRTCTPRTGEVGLYVGTRPENLAEALAVVAAELERCVEDPASEEELTRSRENLKGRVVLGAGVDRRAHEPPRRVRC